MRAPHLCVSHMCAEEHICASKKAFRRGQPRRKGVIQAHVGVVCSSSWALS
jgi:hypothetical protein